MNNQWPPSLASSDIAAIAEPNSPAYSNAIRASRQSCSSTTKTPRHTTRRRDPGARAGGGQPVDETTERRAPPPPPAAAGGPAEVRGEVALGGAGGGPR